jgi:hypothetical protein
MTGISLSQSGNKIHSLTSSQPHMMPSRVLSSSGNIALNQPVLTSASSTQPTNQSVAISHQSGAQTVTSQTLPATVVTSRRANTSVTIINSQQQSNAAIAAASQVCSLVIYKLLGSKFFTVLSQYSKSKVTLIILAHIRITDIKYRLEAICFLFYMESFVCCLKKVGG